MRCEDRICSGRPKPGWLKDRVVEGRMTVLGESADHLLDSQAASGGPVRTFLPSRFREHVEECLAQRSVGCSVDWWSVSRRERDEIVKGVRAASHPGDAVEVALRPKLARHCG